ncbi:MAG: nucleotidyltransferase domain-containing protein [Petrimonas sp.]|nr:nucleotidyltransferase domain-containing protein [Petrimonas sp.]
MFIENEIKKAPKQFKELCRMYDVELLYAFGSSVGSKRFDPDKSDIDLMVELSEDDPLVRGERLLSLWDALENFFRRKVDLLTKESLRNPYLIKSIENSKVLIYDGKSAEILI